MITLQPGSKRFLGEIKQVERKQNTRQKGHLLYGTSFMVYLPTIKVGLQNALLLLDRRTASMQNPSGRFVYPCYFGQTFDDWQNLDESNECRHYLALS
jgi:hypothetical protein